MSLCQIILLTLYSTLSASTSPSAVDSSSSSSSDLWGEESVDRLGNRIVSEASRGASLAQSMAHTMSESDGDESPRDTIHRAISESYGGESLDQFIANSTSRLTEHHYPMIGHQTRPNPPFARPSPASSTFNRGHSNDGFLDNSHLNRPQIRRRAALYEVLAATLRPCLEEGRDRPLTLIDFDSVSDSGQSSLHFHPLSLRAGSGRFDTSMPATLVPHPVLHENLENTYQKATIAEDGSSEESFGDCDFEGNFEAVCKIVCPELNESCQDGNNRIAELAEQSDEQPIIFLGSQMLQIETPQFQGIDGLYTIFDFDNNLQEGASLNLPQ